MTPALDSRLRQYRRRALVRAWEYRQRDHAHGVWFRLRRVLAQAGGAAVISHDDAVALTAEGYGVEAVGAELDPPKMIVFAPADRVARLQSARPIEVRLSAALLSADCLALTPFAARFGPSGGS